MPAKIAASTVVPVAMSMTARVGKDAPALGRNAFVSMLYISKDNKLDSFDYMWTAIPHTTGKQDDFITYVLVRRICYTVTVDIFGDCPWVTIIVRYGDCIVKVTAT